MLVSREQIVQGSFSPESTVDRERAALKSKRGLLVRILSGKKDGEIYDAIRRIEDNFKVGGDRTEMYPYRTKQGTRIVLATPEDLRTVLVMRHKGK